MNTLVELLEASAARYPDRVALTMRAGVRATRYTYAELLRRSHAWARLLASRGVSKGDRVIAWAPNQPEWVAAMFGTFIAGGVLVPLDVRSSPEFVARVVARVEPKAAFAGRSQAEELARLEVPALVLEGVRPPLDGPFLGPPLSGADLAEVIFTSGTTGDPKGVMLTHRNIVANVESGLSVIDIGPGTRMLSLLPLSHMFEQTAGCFAPIAAGAAVCYPASRQPASLSRVMQEGKPTVIIGVPQVLSLLMAGIEREAAAHGRLGLLRMMRRISQPLPARGRRLVFHPVLSRFGGALDFVASGGAPLDPEVQLKWEAMGIAVVEGYGTTECAPIVTINPREDRRVGSVGRPLPGQQVRIADDGEVLTRGENVFIGYWQAPEATAAAFDGDWYRTGDLGYLQDGYLYLKGRKKDLIVLADGQNVYPEDIEAVLRRQPGVTDAVVLGLAVDGQVRLHAVIAEAAPGSAAEAVRRANQQLDARQQILGWSTWPEPDFPRTHTLKVRRPLVEAYLREHQPPPAPPQQEVADPLLRIIAALRRTDAPLDDATNLGADLGLDSLARVELLSAVEDELGVYVDDADVGPQTTIGELRRMVAKGERKVRIRKFPTWPRWRTVQWLRHALLSFFVFPLLRIGYSVEVRGRERFATVQQPCLIIANHNMHLDQAMLLRSMPPGFRRRVAIAAAASDIFGNRLRGFFASLLGNAFPFAKEGSGVRESLEYVAKMLGEGWNVLIFPEGKLTVIGPMQPFKSGTGLLAVETGVPVLPMRIDVLRPGFYEGKWLPHPRARVRVSIGEPIRFEPGTSYQEATRRLEEAVRNA
ncbi:AMP-binding protein [Tepidiforma thermophila]|uniref:Long-chain acyl-CoA synthetase n=1 Tax=Tepidiforma thermophila (strain KCTC 52669 / CGMCC 1.13589 / G233) TaxID=2761530 RepID=A0A2A9HI35_TEPT2|nr:AMP-binding protein [Tepidiforma thermophila]PFG74479.1 long-chain acyl-CoA synthetase [Tepidiforma thermophila]